MPCDITDFVSLYPRVRHDKAFVVIIALLKGPFATAHFVKKALTLAPDLVAEIYVIDVLCFRCVFAFDVLGIRFKTTCHGLSHSIWCHFGVVWHTLDFVLRSGVLCFVC